MRILLLISLLILTSNIKGQGLYFPTVGDGSRSPKANFGYKDYVPLEVYVDSIISLHSSNGLIKKSDHFGYNYFIQPARTGNLLVTLIAFSDGTLDTLSARITIVERPKLKLVAHQRGDSIKVNLLDSSGIRVTDDFYSALEGEIIFNSQKYYVQLRDLNTWINYKSRFSLNEAAYKNGVIIHFETIAVYSRKFDLFTGRYACSLKVN